MAPPSLSSRLAGGVWGHLVGDAMGVPYEFRKPGDIRRVTFGASGSHRQPPGTWSDDGALMLATLDSLLVAGFDPDDQGRRYVDWYDRAAYTPDGDPHFDVGRTTATAIGWLRNGARAEDAGGTKEADNGNGSLMRVLPIALAGLGDPAHVLVDRAHRSSRVTHAHPWSQVACALYVLAAFRLLAGDDRDAALRGATTTLRAEYDRADTHPVYAPALARLLEHTGREGRGFVVDSFWSAWDAFAGADGYQSTITRAIAYGHDTDTTACIAGGLAGIFWGLEGIPSEWLDGMRGHALVDPLVARLTAPSRTRARPAS